MATTQQARRDRAGIMQERVLGLHEWRADHPQATFAAIEAEVDRRWHVPRAQLLADLARASAATAGAAAPTVPCPQCGGTQLRNEGLRERTVRTLGQAPVTLRRAYATCIQCGYRFFPLDADLGLLPNHRFSPRVEALAARLGSTVDFAEATALLDLAVGVQLGATTVRRCTYAAGAAALAVEAEALVQAMQAPVRAAQPPAVLQVRLDATTVPLVGGGWTDVQLAVFADLAPGAPGAAGGPTLVPQTTSYVARWEPAAQCGPTITLEAQRRGIDEAAMMEVVVSPNDGAEWIQGTLDLIAPQAIRVLDFPHAAEHLGVLAALVYGEGSAEAGQWVAAQRQVLHDRGADALLQARAICQARGPCPSALVDAEGHTPQDRLQREVTYFTSRVSQLAYPTFRQQGYPIGSGAVESGHTVVIGARFKGAGQHWASQHLNPLLVLRCATCHDRWATIWAAAWTRQGQDTRQARAAAQQQRRAARLTLLPAAQPLPPAADPAAPPTSTTAHEPVTSAPSPPPKLVVAGRPTIDHPWRRFSLHPRQRAIG